MDSGSAPPSRLVRNDGAVPRKISTL